MPDANFTIVCHSGGALVSKKKNIMKAHFNDNVPSVRFTISKTAYVSKKINYNIWHKRLGHISQGKLKIKLFEDTCMQASNKSIAGFTVPNVSPVNYL